MAIFGGWRVYNFVEGASKSECKEGFAHPKQPSTAQINFFSVFDKLYINSGARYSGWGGMYYCLRFLFSLQGVRFFLQGVCFLRFFFRSAGCMFIQWVYDFFNTKSCRVYVYLMVYDY